MAVSTRMRQFGRPWLLESFATISACGALSIINPIGDSALSPAQVDICKVEPYVVASDVYAVFPHVGAAAGHGLLVPPHGCTGLSWNHFWECRLIRVE